MKKELEKPDYLNMPLIPPLGMPIAPLGRIITDPLGGYTGRPIDPDEIPVQDADDL